jgi:hypothetical protein
MSSRARFPTGIRALGFLWLTSWLRRRRRRNAIEIEIEIEIEIACSANTIATACDAQFR